jgi:hypothetical protein
MYGDYLCLRLPKSQRKLLGVGIKGIPQFGRARYHGTPKVPTAHSTTANIATLPSRALPRHAEGTYRSFYHC